MKVYKGDGVLYNEHPDPLLCPFCGKEVKVIPYSMSGSRHVISHPKTERLQPGSARRWGDLPCPMEAGRPVVYETKARAIEAWNTRAERTCRIEYHYGEWYCNGCGHMVGTCDTASELYIDGNAIELWKHCPNCGAKVVSE